MRCSIAKKSELAPQIEIQSAELMLVLPSKLLIAEGLGFEPASN